MSATLRHFLCICIFLELPGLVSGQDSFDRLTRPTLLKWSESDSFSPVKEEISSKDLATIEGRFRDQNGAFLLVKTAGGHWARLLVQQARQKIDSEKSVPILMLDRYATSMDGEERALIQSGKEVRLFAGFRYSLDLGQVVPPELPADLEIMVDGKGLKIRKDKATSIWIPSKEISGPKVAKPPAVDTTKPFGPHWFAGHFKLYDDGRRTGRLEIEVDKDGNLSGAMFSDKDNKRYELFGKVGMPNHTAQFTVRFPRTEQYFQATLFTGDGSALTGTTRFGERETGFYAKRIDD